MSQTITVSPSSLGKSKRIASIDILRIMAAIGVMYEHIPSAPTTPVANIFHALPTWIFGVTAPVFFVISGYFAHRNNTWSKSISYAWKLLIPFLLWNFAVMLSEGEFGVSLLDFLQKLTGVNTLFLLWFGDHQFGVPFMPANGPLWFMRDLIILSCFSPLILPNARFIFVTLLTLSVCPATSIYFEHDAATGATLSLYSIAYYSAGCCLGTLSLPSQQKILQSCTPWFVFIFIFLKLALSIGVMLIIPIALTFDVTFSLLSGLLSIAAWYQLARLIELKMSFLTQWLMKFAPVTVLIYTAHPIIFAYVESTPLQHSEYFIIFLPILCCILMSIVFYTLKHITPGILPYIALYRSSTPDKTHSTHTTGDKHST